MVRKLQDFGVVLDKNYSLIWILLFMLSVNSNFGQANGYLDTIEQELKIRWPENRTIRLVFHGHSVPAGYFKNGVVNSLESYPYLVLKKLNEIYPHAVISSIVTAIGGEHSMSGADRFEKEVLSLNPDVLFIDYSLNDRSLGLEKAKAAWESMILKALERKVKVILLSPTPDLNEDILSDETALALHSEQVKSLAKKYQLGFVDSYQLFKDLAKNQDISIYMSQNNHPNGLGHDLVANEIIKWFY